VERWAQEFRHLQRTEVLEVEEGFGSEQKGSSAMPHKKNPITGEKLCGLARLLRGNAVAALENVALWHERDISHSSVERIIIPDGTMALDHMLTELDKLVRRLVVHPDRMKTNLGLTRGLICSQELLLLLTSKGIARDVAYSGVQRLAMACWESGDTLRSLVERDPRFGPTLSASELDRVFDLSIHYRDVNRTFKAVGL
jgi:adenylosuccinate lyase